MSDESSIEKIDSIVLVLNRYGWRIGSDYKIEINGVDNKVLNLWGGFVYSIHSPAWQNRIPIWLGPNYSWLAAQIKMNDTTLKTGYRCVYARIVDGLMEYDVRTSYPIDGSSLYDEILKDVFAPLYGIHA